VVDRNPTGIAAGRTVSSRAPRRLALLHGLQVILTENVRPNTARWRRRAERPDAPRSSAFA